MQLALRTLLLASFALPTIASAQVLTFHVCLDGAQAVPPVATTGTGSATVTLDLSNGNYTVTGSFANLTAAATVSHIHGPAFPGMNAGVMVPLVVTPATSGTLTGGGTLSAIQRDDVLHGKTYVNVHTSAFPGGEIRGQVQLGQMLGVSPYSPLMSSLDRSFRVCTEVSLTEGAATVNSANGLARHPVTGDLYIVYKASGFTTRLLGIVDRTTGVITRIGDTGLNIASICFGPGATLYGVTGDGGTPPETLFTLNTTTAAATQILTLGAGSDGESIGFNSTDGLLYHCSGRDTNFAFESIDPTTLTVTPIAISGYQTDEVFGMAHVGGNCFRVTNLDNEVVEMHTNGVCTLLGSITAGSAGTDSVRGFVIDPVASYTLFGTGCAGTAGTPLLRPVGSSLPVLGETFSVRISSAPALASIYGILGFSETFWLSTPLPLNLAPIGLTGCTLYTDLAATAPLTADSSGNAVWNLTFTCDTSLLGLVFDQQALVLEPLGTPVGTTSNAGRGRIGVRN